VRAYEEVTVILDAHANGRTVAVGPGTAIAVTLASNPSTGYSWKLVAGDGRVVHLLSHHYVPPKKALPGAGGSEVWRFVARVRGSVSIVLAYLRPWQPKHVVQRFRVTLHVT